MSCNLHYEHEPSAQAWVMSPCRSGRLKVISFLVFSERESGPCHPKGILGTSTVLHVTWCSRIGHRPGLLYAPARIQSVGSMPILCSMLFLMCVCCLAGSL